MATTFFKTWFTSNKSGNNVKNNKETSKANEGEDPPPIPPERRLSLSKSGKMKRKVYGRQSSVKDVSFFTPSSGNNRGGSDSDSVRNSEQVDIDDVIADLLTTAQNNKV